jgi:hypothetical protein
MTTEDQDYLDLFKPKPGSPEDTPDLEPARTERDAAPSLRTEAWEADVSSAVESEFEPPLSPAAEGPHLSLRTVGVLVGGGCLLLVLAAVVVFAFFQVFARRGDGKQSPTPSPTVAVADTPAPTAPPVAESPFIVPLVSSADVRVPVALPERLIISDTLFTVQVVQTPANTWPPAPTAGDAAAWAYGTVVNYVLSLAPTPQNQALIAALQPGDALHLHMSTDLVLNFNVVEVLTGTVDESTLFGQSSPRLTLGWLPTDPAGRMVVRTTFLSDEAAKEPGMLAAAAIGLVGTPVDQGAVRVTVIETYHAPPELAGLPPDTGYLIVDVRVENIGDTVLETEFFQTFIVDEAGGRYPLTLVAEQFAHYGTPTEALAPGETVIGSLGYLVPRAPGGAGQVRWVFNPLPGSADWVIVPVSYALPPAPPTPTPTLATGFARVTIDPDDVFVDQRNSLLDVGLLIENVSGGTVLVTEADVGLNSWTDGDLSLISAAPPLPWSVAPGESRLFQLQFDLPSSDSALLSVLGYTFSIENLGGQ